MTTAIIGTGNLGATVARRLASGGEPVVISATSQAKAKKLAADWSWGKRGTQQSRRRATRRQCAVRPLAELHAGNDR